MSKLSMQQSDRNASLREVMSSYPTGVTIVAARDEDGRPFGLTVNSFTSLSLDPPLVLVCIGHHSSSHDRLLGCGAFAINLLAADQAEIAGRFASEPSDGRFDAVEWSQGALGAPLIDGAMAWLECVPHEVLHGGDHSIVVGRVQGADVTPREALVFHRGQLGSTG